MRGKVEDSQTINHHGKKLDVEGGKVVNISAVGVGKPNEITSVEEPKTKPNLDLVNVDEKVQRAALKAYYEK